MNKINSNSTNKKALTAFLAVNILLTFIFIITVILDPEDDAVSSSSESVNSGAEFTNSETNYITETVSTTQDALTDNAPQTIELNNITSETSEKDTITINNTTEETIPPLTIPEVPSESTETLPTETSENMPISDFESEPKSELESNPESTISSAEQEMPHNETFKVLTDRDAMKVVSDAFVTDTGGYQEHFTTSESVNVFAEDITNCFSVLCGASFNLWGCGTQEIVFNLNKISKSGDALTFTSGLTSGCSDYIECKIYLDNEEIPYLEFIMNADSAPLTHTIDNLSQHSSMKIVLNNCSGNMNTACFYNFIIE